MRENLSKHEVISKELSDQRDNYKLLYENNVAPVFNDSGSINSQRNIESIQADLILWKSKSERLQEKLEYFSDDRQQHERYYPYFCWFISLRLKFRLEH